jgi:hypothetical protein
MIWEAIRTAASRFSGLLARLWLRRAAPPPPAPTLALPAPHARTVPCPPPVICLPDLTPRPQRPRQHRPSKEIARLKSDVLEKLDKYLVYIKRLKRWDPDAYMLYRRVGAFICTADLLASPRVLEPALVQSLPSFGAVAIGLGSSVETPAPDDDLIHIKFAYFTKLQRPGHDVERVNQGVTYRCHLYWDDKQKLDKVDRWGRRGYGIGQDMLINVLPDGTIRPLRMLKLHHQVIRHRKGHYGASVVAHQRWGLPEVRDETRSAESRGPWANLTLAEAIVTLFSLVANFWIAAARHSMIRVTAVKENVVMPFVVDATDTPAFFADREPVITEDGKRRRIFHVVRAHVRNTPRGMKGVRLHFAGIRDFSWNGYQINITVPGKDHLDIADATFGALEDVPEEEQDGMVLLEEFAETMATMIGSPRPHEQQHA